jgi:hypothetical protein
MICSSLNAAINTATLKELGEYALPFDLNRFRKLTKDG